MVDQTSQFYAILTAVGAAKQANADALGIPWKITQMAVGDGNPGGQENPALPMPDASARALLNEWRRAPLNQLKVDDKNSAVIVAEQVIPADVGGRWIRELALYDADGDMVAVANCAPTYKPLLNQGSGRTQVVRMNLIVSSSSNVQLKIDPSVVLATREWVTEELAKQDFKHSVLVATTAAITLSGLQTVDGIALTAGARVLVKHQAAGKDNGLYLVVASGAWTRCSDADTSAKVTPGMLVPVEKGTVNGDSTWQLVTDGPITLGVSALVYEMAFGRTGVVAGTYRSVSVDVKGRVVAATNPTTVAGYGLTDVYTMAQVDASLALKAPLASPSFTGDPKAPTPVTTDNDTSVATTAFVRNAMALFGLGSKAIKLVGNFDSIVETGSYEIGGGNTGTRPKSPVNGSDLLTAVILHVEKDSTLAFQVWESNSSITSYPFYRSRMSGGAWTAWGQMWNSLNSPKMSNVTDATLDKTVTVGGFGIGKAITSTETDLNSYTVPGNYLTPFSGLSNIPAGWSAITNRRFSMYVKGADESNYLTQTLTSGQSAQVADQVLVAIRVMSTAGNWSEWRTQAPCDNPIFTGDAKAPTTPRGDVSTKIATTEFVKEVGLTFPTQRVALPVGGTFGPVHVGKHSHVSGAGAWTGTVYLPSSGIVPGSVFLVTVSSGAGTLKVQAPTGGYIAFGATSYQSVTIGNDEAPLVLVCLSDTIYTVLSGGLSNTAAYSSLKTSNGWCCHPNGMIEQWGRINVPVGAMTQNVDTVFPIIFPNAVFNVIGSVGVSSTNFDSHINYRVDKQAFNIGAPLLTGFDAQITIDVNPADQRVAFWRALGY